ncbi:unnamed protein product [Linum tenue]|uniref:Arf-GAP domain-containing protein n=2 Tax=Linum tenue TaxID=586396 RepID=A0AAV0MCY4_9ROSI|nr:unnamed protein product [Linum tenue]
MVKKEKEEDKIEKTIRGLLKLPENRRCINCSSLGPQYVCTTFLTFVCTNCSGVHREFTHRVKSVSMAKFSYEEVSALQAGGNERAREIYFKDWNEHRNSYPDGSNLHKLRDFIKHVYVERKYTGERSNEKLRKLRLADNDERYDGRKGGGIYYGRSPSYAMARSSALGMTRSPSYEVTRSPGYEVTRSPSFDNRRNGRDRYGPSRWSSERSFKYYYDEMRSPSYTPESSRYGGGLKKSPVRFEVVDDRFRDNESRSGQSSNSSRLSYKESRSECRSRSPDSEKTIDGSKSAVVPPTQTVPPVNVGKQSRISEGKEADQASKLNSLLMQKAFISIATPSAIKAPTDNTIAEAKSQTLESLIDLDNDSMSPKVVVVAPPPQATEAQPSVNSSIESFVKKEPLAPKPNSVEFLLFELSTPSVTPSAANVSERDTTPPLTISEGSIAALGASSDGSTSMGVSAKCDHLGSSTIESAQNLLADNVSTAGSSDKMSLVPYDVPKRASLAEPYRQSLSLFDAFGGSLFPSAANLPVQPSSGGGASEATPDFFQESSFTANNGDKVKYQEKADNIPSLTVGSTESGQTTSAFVAQTNNQDLFASSFMPTTGPSPSWKYGSSPYDMGFGTQYYHNPMQVMAYPNPVKSTNPFDDNSQRQAHPYPAMGNFGGAPPPNVQHRPILFPSSSTGHISSAMIPDSSRIPSQSFPFESTISSGPYVEHQVLMNLSPFRQQGGSFGIDEDAFSSLNMVQQQRPDGENSFHVRQNSLPSRGGNPFG